MPQYIQAAREMTALERTTSASGAAAIPLARVAFALGGLLLGSLLIALPFIQIARGMFAFALAGPDSSTPSSNASPTNAATSACSTASSPTRPVSAERQAALHDDDDIRESFAIEGWDPEASAARPISRRIRSRRQLGD